MDNGTIFFWLTPITLGTFTLAFLAIAILDRGSQAPKWGAIGYGLGCMGSIIDTVRHVENAPLMIVASILHWAALYGIVRALVARHGRKQPHWLVAVIVTPGIMMMVWTGLVARDPNLGTSNTNFGGALLLIIGIAMLWSHRRTMIDRLLLATLCVSVVSYLGRIALFAPMAADSIAATGTFWSLYNLIFYMSAGLVGLAMAVMLLIALGLDIIAVHNRASNTDALTGISNRRAFDHWIDAARDGRMRVATAMIVDLDHFKRVNDAHGHAVGDAVLIAAARALANIVDVRGHVARIGGEEFAVLVPQEQRAAGRDLAEEIRAGLFALSVDELDGDSCISASVGYADVVHDDVTDAVRRADEALFAAKRQGRNCVSKVPVPCLVAIKAKLPDRMSSAPAIRR